MLVADHGKAPVPIDGAGDVEPHWLDPEQQRDWRATITGMTFLMRALSTDLELEVGLSMAEYELLVRLSEAGCQGVRMAELAEQVAHSRSRVTHTIARLERSDLVERLPARDDRRGVLARITPEGWVRLAEAAPRHVASVRARLVDVVTPEQLHALGDVMRSTLHAAGLEISEPAVLR